MGSMTCTLVFNVRLHVLQKEMNLRRLAAIAARVMTDRHPRCVSGDDSDV